MRAGLANLVPPLGGSPGRGPTGSRPLALSFAHGVVFLTNALPRPDPLTPPCPRTRRVFRPSTAPAYRDGIAGGPGLFAFLHLHPAPLGVVVALAAWMRSQTILAALQGESIQDPESGLPRKNPLGRLVNSVGAAAIGCIRKTPGAILTPG